ANAIDKDEVRLLVRATGDGLQVNRVDRAHAPILHLVEVCAAADVAHEDQALDRLDVRARGDLVDGDGYAEAGVVPQVADQIVSLGLTLVGDLLGEVPVVLGELVADDLQDVLGV